jgi:hypothetical protein
MYAMQFAKVLSKTSSPLERLAATKNIVLLWLVGDVLSSALMALSGRRRKEYTLINTLTWQFGGLSFGIARDATTFLNDMLLAAAGDEVDKQRVLSALPQEASRLGDVLVGFYRITFDTLEALTDEKAGLDIRYMRKIRAFFDKTYTPQEQDKAERTVVEAAQKIIMGSEAPDPIVFEKAQDTLKQDEDKLGTISAIGQSYTLQQFGGDIDKTFTNIPDFLVIEEAGWSDLVMFHAQCSDAWKEYDELPTTPSKIREDWRLTHPEEEAMMLFWGKLSKSIHRRGSTAGNETMTLLRSWWDRYGITSDKRPKADWLDGGAIVEE